MCRNATTVGGGGTIAGALDVSCETPEGFTLVNTIEDMISAMNSSNVQVALAPGEYLQHKHYQMKIQRVCYFQ